VAPSHWKPELAGPIEEALQAALAKVPAERVPSVDAFWVRLGPLLQGGLSASDVASPVAPAMPAATPVPGPRESLPGATLTTRRSPSLKLALGIAGGTAVMLGLWSWWRRPEATPIPVTPGVAAPSPAAVVAPGPPPAPPGISPRVAPEAVPVEVAPPRATPVPPSRGGKRKSDPHHKAAGKPGDMILEGV
jgi:hypothetical protein